MKFKKITGIMLFASIVTAFTACDDGYVNETVAKKASTGYNVKVIGTFNGVDTWAGKYSVALACFDEGNDYSVSQKVIPASVEGGQDTIVLENVPSTVKTIELAVVNSLRKRIATVYSYTIPEGQSARDTIMLEPGSVDLSMFAALNDGLFQNTTVNCAQCHSSSHAAANLDMTSENAYNSLVGVTAHKNELFQRVKPGSSDDSYLYKVLTDNAEEVHYSHAALMADHQTMLSVLKAWIDGGAKK